MARNPAASAIRPTRICCRPSGWCRVTRPRRRLPSLRRRAGGGGAAQRRNRRVREAQTRAVLRALRQRHHRPWPGGTGRPRCASSFAGVALPSQPLPARHRRAPRHPVRQAPDRPAGSRRNPSAAPFAAGCGQQRLQRRRRCRGKGAPDGAGGCTSALISAVFAGSAFADGTAANIMPRAATQSGGRRKCPCRSHKNGLRADNSASALRQA